MRLTNYQPIKTGLIVALVFLSTLRDAVAPAIKLLGLGVLLLLLSSNTVSFLYKLLVSRHCISSALRRCGIIAMMLVLYYATNACFLDWGTNAFIRLMQLVLITGFTLNLAARQWDTDEINVFVYVITIMFVLYLSYWLGEPVHDIEGYRAYFENPNSLGAFLFFLLFFPLAKVLTSQQSKHNFFWLILLGLGGVLIILSKSRSVCIAGLLAVFTYLIWPFLCRHKLSYQLFIWSIPIILLVGSYGYIDFSHHALGQKVNHFFFTHTGKNLFSGRHVMWAKTFELISTHYWFGQGINISTKGLFIKGISTHNLYLQFLLESGLVGLTLFWSLIAYYWKCFKSNALNPIVRLGAAFFVGGLVHQAFEVSLTQNNLAISLPFWLITAITLSQAANLETSNKTGSYQQ